MADERHDNASTHSSQRSPEVGPSRLDGSSRSGRDGIAVENLQLSTSSLQRTTTGGDPSRRRPMSPEHVSSGSPRNPAYIRRHSSTRPQREFSVDDAREEVVDENAPRSARYASGSLRRLPSTVRRRPNLQSRLPTLESTDFEDALQPEDPVTLARISTQDARNSLEEERTLLANVEPEVEPEVDEVEGEDVDDNGDDDGDVSDAESFTLKDRQDAINETHPFGIRIWKPALYKKSRSVEKGAEGDIHSTPGGMVPGWLQFFNLLWTLIFGWWLAILAATGGLLCHLFAFAPGCKEYGRVLWGFARYIFYPFGKYVKLIQEEAYAEEDHGEGRSITEYEQWQSGDLEEGRLFFGPIRSLVGRRRSDEDSEDDETDPLLERTQGTDPGNGHRTKLKKRLFGRGQWTLGRVIFFIFFYGGLTPSLLLVSGICWLLVYSVPMARVTYLLFDHLRRRPLALEFHSESTQTRGPGDAPSAILLCTYRAVGTKYWKYTIGGTNIFLINFLGIVVFVIFDYWVLYVALGIRVALTDPIFVFLMSLISIIPLAYFIGQAVASISAQSTMGVGAAVNAFFSTIVEVFLYCIALKEGKGQLVEGSVIGSIFAGILLLPGLSMCFGALKRKTQRFNVKSAGVTTTMLLFATIGAFGPTLFYQIYGAHELNCQDCADDHDGDPLDRDCRRCFFAQIPAIHDPFFVNAVRPFIWFAAVLLFLSYIIGLFFTLRTHAATIWEAELDEKKPEKVDSGLSFKGQQKIASIDYGTMAGAPRQGTSVGNARADIKDTQLYKRILNQSLSQVGADASNLPPAGKKSPSAPASIYPVAEDAREDDLTTNSTGTGYNQFKSQVAGVSQDANNTTIRKMAEVAATAAAVAARDFASNARHGARRRSATAKANADQHQRIPSVTRPEGPPEEVTATAEAANGGHDAPNWGRAKSYIVLLSATVAYAIIAEILVDTVDSVLENSDIDEKFLGITLFALVPNTTEFLNAISFAVNGNIALSMEIGSAYALQVCLLQIPALVLFSALFSVYGGVAPSQLNNYTFSLIFPQWDMVTVILCVFLLSYMYGEGKSNYFKGSILILSYLVVVAGFYAAGFSSVMVRDPNDDDGLGLSKTMMRRSMNGGGKAFVL